MTTSSTPFDWSSFDGANAPAGYTATYTPGATTTRGGNAMPSGGPGPSDAAPGGGGGSSQYASHGLTGNTPTYGTAASGGDGGSTSAGAWGLRDASGKVYGPGDALNLAASTPTGETTGGFDDAFYNKYKQNVLDYYMPQVDKQYKDAKNQATYGLARSGNIRSSAANTLTADLANQNDINTAGVRNQADTAAGDLRSQVANEEQKATSQLYATEDPEVAAQQALSAVQNISLSQPNMSPLSALFNVASIGGANVLKGYKGQQNLNTFNNALPKARSTNVV
jgi:hypothetical protein